MSQNSIMESGQEMAPVLNHVDEFPCFDIIEHGDLLSLSLSTDTTPFTHGLHRFPAKYIPQVPRWAINQFCNEESVVLDPFMGSGTTLVEGLQTAKDTYGLDIDPLARLISASKVEKYNLHSLKNSSAEILQGKGKRKVGSELPMAGVKNPEHWFTIDNKQYLNYIFDKINKIDCSDSERRFFQCVFSSTLRWVSNADDQSQKTYVSGTLKKTPPNAWDVFEKFLNRAIDGASRLDKERQLKSSAVILDGDALNIPLPANSVDLIVTSPPYVDSVDYMYNFMMEYFWLGPTLGVENRTEYNRRRKGAVGSKNPLEKKLELPQPIQTMVDISSIPDYRKSAVIGYYHSMLEHFTEASRVLKNNGRYVLVVGNSQSINGVMPVHDCLNKLALSVGLVVEKAFAYRIRRHYMKFPRKGRGGIILMDWVITLKKQSSCSESDFCSLPIPEVSIGHDEVAH